MESNLRGIATSLLIPNQVYTFYLQREIEFYQKAQESSLFSVQGRLYQPSTETKLYLGSNSRLITIPSTLLKLIGTRKKSYSSQEICLMLLIAYENSTEKHIFSLMKKSLKSKRSRSSFRRKFHQILNDNKSLAIFDSSSSSENKSKKLIKRIFLNYLNDMKTSKDLKKVCFVQLLNEIIKERQLL